MSQIRTSTFWKTTFTRDCINHDREAICSGAFLTKATAFDAAEKIGKALHEFVVALFDSGNRKLSQKNVMNLPKIVLKLTTL